MRWSWPRDRDDVEELRRLHAFQRSLGLDAEWLTPSECRRLEPGLSPRCAGGILAPQDHQVDPLAVVAALLAACERAGAEIVGGDAVIAVDEHGVRTALRPLDRRRERGGGRGLLERPRASTDCRRRRSGRSRARSSRCAAHAERPLAEHLVRTLRCYVVDRGDGRVVLGATMEERGFDTTVTADGVYRLLEAAWEVLPDVGRARAGGRARRPAARHSGQRSR